MSAYMSIFLKRNNKYMELFGYGRSTTFFEIAYDTIHIPYENVVKISEQDILSIISYTEDYIKSLKKNIKEYKDIMNQVGSWNASIDEKLEVFAEYTSSILETKEIIQEYKSNISMLRALLNIIRRGKYHNWIEGDGIYAGIDIDEDILN